MTKHKHQWQFVEWGTETWTSGNFAQEMVYKKRAIFICECGKKKEVKVK